MEEWKPIEGYEGLYEVSNLGRVKSLWYGKERMLKMGKDKLGYLRVFLCNNNKGKNFLIHRLVAKAFIPNPDNKPFIDHIDTNPSNNRIENLRWCTHKENCNNPLTIEKYSKNNSNLGKYGKLHQTSKPILQFSLNGEFIKKWNCAKDAARELNINDNHIGSCCRGKRKTTYGYIWKYYDIELYCISIMKKNFKKVA